jgi:hypothetical protein
MLTANKQIVNMYVIALKGTYLSMDKRRSESIIGETIKRGPSWAPFGLLLGCLMGDNQTPHDGKERLTPDRLLSS